MAKASYSSKTPKLSHDLQIRELIKRAMQGSKDAARTLVAHPSVQSGVLKFCRYLLKDSSGTWGEGNNAFDLCQISLLKIWQGVARLEDPEKFDGWAMTIVRNTYLDGVRTAQSRIQFYCLDECADLPAELSDPFDNCFGREIDAFILTLPTTTQKILRMRIDDPKSSFREIGITLGISHTHVRNLVRKAWREYEDQ